MTKCCDMRGLLSFLILRLISKKPMCGEGIRKEIEARKGSKPSPGTIYPVLKQLLQNGWIKEIGCENTKQRLYQITPAGKKEATAATNRFVKYFFDLGCEFKN